MPEIKKYIKRIMLPSETIARYIYDEDAIHTNQIGNYLKDYLPINGGTITGDLTVENDVTIEGTLTASTISLENIEELTTPVSNILTKDEDDNNKLKYHPTNNLLYEIGGIGKVEVDNHNTVIYSLGKN